MRNNFVSRIVVVFVLLCLLSACSTPNAPVPTNTALPQPSNTSAPPTATPAPPTKIPATNTPEPTQEPFVNPSIYDIPAMYEVIYKEVMFNSISDPIKALPMRIYYPPGWKAGQKSPAVILANDWPRGGAWEKLAYPLNTVGLFSNLAGWGHILAANGLIAVSYATAYPNDLEAVVKYLQDHSAEVGIDATHLGLFGASSNSMLVGAFSNQPNRDYIKFAVYFYSDAVTTDSPYYQPLVDSCKQYGCYFGELPRFTKYRTDLPIFLLNTYPPGSYGYIEIEYFHSKLTALNVPLTYVDFQGVPWDGFDYKLNVTGTPISADKLPEGIKIIQQAVDFMIKYANAP